MVHYFGSDRRSFLLKILRDSFIATFWMFIIFFYDRPTYGIKHTDDYLTFHMRVSFYGKNVCTEQMSLKDQ